MFRNVYLRKYTPFYGYDVVVKLLVGILQVSESMPSGRLEWD